MRILMILLVLVFSGKAFADLSLEPVPDTNKAVLIGGWSDHVVTDYDYNEQHDAVLIEYGSYMAGRFTNSHGRPTAAIGKIWRAERGDFDFSVAVGLMYGYRGCYGDEEDSATVCPMVYPAVTYVKYRIQPQLGLLGEAVVFIVRIELSKNI